MLELTSRWKCHLNAKNPPGKSWSFFVIFAFLGLTYYRGHIYYEAPPFETVYGDKTSENYLFIAALRSVSGNLRPVENILSRMKLTIERSTETNRNVCLTNWPTCAGNFGIFDLCLLVQVCIWRNLRVLCYRNVRSDFVDDKTLHGMYFKSESMFVWCYFRYILCGVSTFCYYGAKLSTCPWSLLLCCYY